MDALDEINAIADASPGFVWRFQTEDGNATAERPFDDDAILVNFSTWTSVDALADFVYRSAHAAVPPPAARVVRADGRDLQRALVGPGRPPPDGDEAIERLDHLRKHGPTPSAFTFRHRFTADEAVEVADPRDVCSV